MDSMPMDESRGGPRKDATGGDGGMRGTVRP